MTLYSYQDKCTRSPSLLLAAKDTILSWKDTEMKTTGPMLTTPHLRNNEKKLLDWFLCSLSLIRLSDSTKLSMFTKKKKCLGNHGSCSSILTIVKT